MALSEQERKLLEQLEASLMAEDPKFADTLSGNAEVRVHRRRAAAAGLGFVLGVLILLGGVQVHWTLSVLGFVVMLAAALVGISSWRRVDDGGQPAKPSTNRSKPSPTPESSSDFMTRLEEQWRRRQEGDK